jgi:competence protein ComEA
MEPTATAVPERPTPRRSPVERARSWIEWFGPARLVAGALALVGVAAAAFWLLRSPPPPVEDFLPMATTSVAHDAAASAVTPTSMSVEATSNPVEVVVHVGGAVNVAGVHRLPLGARVVDAVAAAGGLSGDAAPDALNLAATLHDGDRVVVPRVTDLVAVPAGVTPTTASAAASHAAAKPGPVSLNTAGADELEDLPGVGPAIASAIVTYRDEHGPFLTVDELTEVPGIGPAKLATLRELVSV